MMHLEGRISSLEGRLRLSARILNLSNRLDGLVSLRPELVQLDRACTTTWNNAHSIIKYNTCLDNDMKGLIHNDEYIINLDQIEDFITEAGERVKRATTNLDELQSARRNHIPLRLHPIK